MKEEERGKTEGKEEEQKIKEIYTKWQIRREGARTKEEKEKIREEEREKENYRR